MVEEERLKVFCTLAASIAVADMANSHLARKLCNLLLIEDLAHETVTLYPMKLTFCVNCHDTATLLTSVLKGVQAVISHACSILNTVDSKHTTLVVKFVIPIIIFTLTHFVVRFLSSVTLRGNMLLHCG